MSPRKITVLAALVCSASMLHVACNNGEPKAVEIIRPVRYKQVFSTGGSKERTFSGAAKSGVQSNLSFKVSGTILAIPVKVGDRVRSGQLIARLSPEDYRLRVQQAEAALAQARAQARNAKADYERIEGLYENNNASKDDLDAARAAKESAAAQVEAAEKQLELARLQLSYTRLLAPTDGLIASVDVDVGENVRPGQRVVLLTAGSRIEVEVAIPEVLIADIVEGDSVEVAFDALPGRRFDAVVTEVGVAATQFATTYPVTVRLLESDPDIRPGMAAEVTFRFRAKSGKERFVVPSFSVSEDREGPFVYVVEPVSQDTGIVRKRKVEIGELDVDGLEILQGLSDGEMVVTAGVSQLHDGQRVRF